MRAVTLFKREKHGTELGEPLRLDRRDARMYAFPSPDENASSVSGV